MYRRNLFVPYGVNKVLGLGVLSHQTQSACNSLTPTCADVLGTLPGPGDREDKMSTTQTSNEDPNPWPPVLVGRAAWRCVGRALGVPGAQQRWSLSWKGEGEGEGEGNGGGVQFHWPLGYEWASPEAGGAERAQRREKGPEEPEMRGGGVLLPRSVAACWRTAWGVVTSPHQLMCSHTAVQMGDRPGSSGL